MRADSFPIRLCICKVISCRTVALKSLARTKIRADMDLTSFSSFGEVAAGAFGSGLDEWPRQWFGDEAGASVEGEE